MGNNPKTKQRKNRQLCGKSPHTAACLFMPYLAPEKTFYLPTSVWEDDWEQDEEDELLEEILEKREMRDWTREKTELYSFMICFMVTYHSYIICV